MKTAFYDGEELDAAMQQRERKPPKETLEPFLFFFFLHIRVLLNFWSEFSVFHVCRYNI